MTTTLDNFSFPFTSDKNPHNRCIDAHSIIKHRVRSAKQFLLQQQDKLNAKQNKDGYWLYTRADNPELFDILETCGFFDFHCSNTKMQVVMVHQVNKYILGSGWKYYLKGYVCKKGEVECHHLDGDISNNNPQNIAYVSPMVNKLCAQACNLNYLGHIKKKMSESMSQAAHIIAVSVKRTYKRIYGKVLNIPAVQWLLSLPHNLKEKKTAIWQIPPSLTFF